MIGTYSRHYKWTLLKTKDGILRNNTNARNHFYQTESKNLWDKLIRRETYIKSINFMNEEFTKEIYFLNNDETAMFGIIHVAESYGFFQQIGYFYILKDKGEYYYRTDKKNVNLIFRNIFNNIKYFYLKSDNNTNEKIHLAYKYFDKNIRKFKTKMQYFTEGFDYILEVFDLYLNSSYFDYKQKRELNMIKSYFIFRKNNLKSNNIIRILFFFVIVIALYIMNNIYLFKFKIFTFIYRFILKIFLYILFNKIKIKILIK